MSIRDNEKNGMTAGPKSTWYVPRARIISKATPRRPTAVPAATVGHVSDVELRWYRWYSPQINNGQFRIHWLVDLLVPLVEDSCLVVWSPSPPCLPGIQWNGEWLTSGCQAPASGKIGKIGKLDMLETNSSILQGEKSRCSWNHI